MRLIKVACCFIGLFAANCIHGDTPKVLEDTFTEAKQGDLVKAIKRLIKDGPITQHADSYEEQQNEVKVAQIQKDYGAVQDCRITGDETIGSPRIRRVQFVVLCERGFVFFSTDLYQTIVPGVAPSNANWVVTGYHFDTNPPSLPNPSPES